jgi:N-carbamoyl-L-amino-acid hydrolase
MAAVEVASHLYELLREGDEHLRLTVGRMRVEPGSINVIPGKVEMSIDLRHPDSAVLDSVEASISELAGRVLACDVTLERTMLAEPIEFDDRIVDLLERNAQRLGLPCRILASGSFHDALRLARLCPSGMIFVPSIGGLSHNPDEWTPPRDMAAATRLLALTAVELADQVGD